MAQTKTPDSQAALDALVVGGDKGFQSQISEFLAERGFSVSTCESIDNAPENYNHHRVVLTVVPPGANGELGVFVNSIRELADGRQPIIVGIGKSLPRSIRKTGFDELLEAPIDLDDLAERIDSKLKNAAFPKRTSGSGILERLLSSPKPIAPTPNEPQQPLPGSAADPFRPANIPPPRAVPDNHPDSHPANSEPPFEPAFDAIQPEPAPAPEPVAQQPRPPEPAPQPAEPAPQPESQPQPQPQPVQDQAPAPAPQPPPAEPAPVEPTPGTPRAEHVQILLENAPLAMAMFDGDMRYLAANRLWLEEFHLADVPLIGRTQYEIFPDLHESWHRIYNRCLEGHIERCDEDVFTRADGSQDWVRWEVRPWNNDQQAIGGLIISCEVITHLKRAQRQLHFERNLAAALFSTHSAPIMVIDLKGRIIRANPAANQLIPTQKLTEQGTPYWNQLLSDQQRDAAAFFFSSLDNEDNRTAEVPATTLETLSLESGEATVTWLNIPQRHADGSIEAIVRIGALQDLRPPKPDPVEPYPAAAPAAPEHDPDAPLPVPVDPAAPALDDLPDPVWRCDIRGRLEYINRAWIDTRRLVGRDEIAKEYGKGWLGAFHERDRRNVANKISEAINDRAPFALEARILRLGDTDLPVMLRGKPAYDVDDHFLGLVGTVTDFSEKALIEDTLHALRKEATAPVKPQPAPEPAREPEPEPQPVAQQPLTKPHTDSPESTAALAIAGALPCGLLLIDPTGDLLYANDLHADITGADAREFSSIEDWLVDRCTDSTHRAAVIDSWRDKIWRKQVRRVLPLVSADDVLKEIEFRPTLLADGRLLVVVNDVTESHRSQEALRASESRLRALVREAGIPFAAIDKTGDISTASTAFEHLLDYSPLQLRRLNFDDCLHPDDIAIKDEILRHVHDTTDADTRKTFPVRLRTRSGETVDAELRATAIHDDRGAPILTAFFVAPAPNVEQASLPATPVDEPKPEPQPAQSPEADPATTSHRARNDLQLIFSLLNLQRTLTADPSARAAITAGQARVRAITTIHQQIEDAPAGTASVDLSKFVADLSKQLLGDTTDGLADRIKTEFALDGVTIPLNQGASLGLVINELLANAYHHAFPENISGTVRVSATSDPFTGQLSIVIKDDGVGLPHEFAIGTTPGLGLQIVEALTDQLEGRLDIANDDETEFRVTVPIID